MADYIDRQAALDAIQQHREDVLDSYEYDEGVAFVYAAAHNHIIDVIKLLPSADVEPVRHGRWIEENPLNASDCRLIKCSECGLTFIVPSNIPYEDWVDGRNYCYSCGARMDGEEYEL